MNFETLISILHKEFPSQQNDINDLEELLYNQEFDNFEILQDDISYGDESWLKESIQSQYFNVIEKCIKHPKYYLNRSNNNNNNNNHNNNYNNNYNKISNVSINNNNNKQINHNNNNSTSSLIVRRLYPKAHSFSGTIIIHITYTN